MVDKLDQGLVPAELGPLDYKGLYNVMSTAVSFFVSLKGLHQCCDMLLLYYIKNKVNK